VEKQAAKLSSLHPNSISLPDSNIV